MGSNKITVNQEGFANSIGLAEFEYDWMAYQKNYNCKNMSKNAIYVETCRLLQNPKVALRIAEIRTRVSKEQQVTLEKVLTEMSHWIMFDPIKLVNEADGIHQLRDMDPETRRSISEITVSEIWGMVEGNDGKSHKEQIGELKKVKFYDKTKVADMFMKKFGAYITKDSLGNNSLDHIADVLGEINDKLPDKKNDSKK